jgi:hypothetical protein
LALKLDKDTARQRLATDGRAFLDDPALKPQIEENWRFVFQEPLIIEQREASADDPRKVDQAPTGTGPGRQTRSSTRKRREN